METLQVYLLNWILELPQYLRGVVSLGKIAADHLPPANPPPPIDGKLSVKNWRQQVQTNHVQEEQSVQVSIKELVEKRRRKSQTPGVFGYLAAGLRRKRASAIRVFEGTHHEFSSTSFSLPLVASNRGRIPQTFCKTGVWLSQRSAANRTSYDTSVGFRGFSMV
jgi:hypothetical protein